MLLGAAIVVVVAVFLVHRRRGRRAERRVGDLAGILAMDGARFDAFVARLYRKDGWWAFEPHAAVERAGIDIRLERGGETWLVRARNWRYRSASAADLRDFYALLVDRGASGGFFVTTSRFTSEAQTFARRVPRTRPLGLIDGDELLGWARRGRVPSRTSRAPAPTEPVLESFRRLGQSEFAQQVRAAWERQGYSVTGQSEVLEVERDGERLLFQSLAANEAGAEEDIGRELVAAASERGTAGVLVTTAEVPSDVRRRLRDQRVDIIEGEALARFLGAAARSGNSA